MPSVTDTTFHFIQDQYRYAVYEVSDDPDEVCEDEEDLKLYIAELIIVGKDINMDFWETVHQENPKMVSKLKNFLNGE